MPALQMDGGVIGMPAGAAAEALRIATHGGPGPCLGVRTVEKQIVIGGLGEAAGKAGADVNDFTAETVSLLHHVRLASVTAANGLPAKNEFVVEGDGLIDGYEEPFSLATEGGV